MLLAAQGLFPTIKQFVDLGLSRHWLNVGEAVFKEGDAVDDGLYVLITGRIKLKSRGSKVVTELGRGDMIGEESFLTSAKPGEGSSYRSPHRMAEAEATAVFQVAMMLGGCGCSLQRRDEILEVWEVSGNFQN